MKKRVIEKNIAGEMKAKDASEILGISRQMFHRLKKTYIEFSEVGLKPKKPGPKKGFRARNRLQPKEGEVDL